jgi:hypothetical protein
MSNSITNYSTAVFLLNNQVRAVLGIYKPDPLNTVNAPLEKRVMFKTLDKDIKKDDLVLVPSTTRHGITTFKITDVDVDVDLESNTKVDWIIGVVDRTDYDQVLAQEASAINAIKSAQTTKKRKELRDTLMADVPMDTIKALPIAQFNGDQPKE